MLLKAQILKESLVHCGTCSCMSYVCITLTNHAYKPHLLLQHVYVCGASCVTAARDLKRRLQYERFAMDSTASSIVMLDCYGSLPVDFVSLFSSTNDSLVPPFTDSQESDTSSVLVFDFQSDWGRFYSPTPCPTIQRLTSTPKSRLFVNVSIIATGILVYCELHCFIFSSVITTRQ